ncbi:Fic family protein [Cyclonatronum proteinivorum]|uniref:Fic family protein n=1 Tax=Cyclonatronum proteinivorum TaxID=1457365 RepID=A0A345UG53_9BACT|nr:Fic family protein [Cyclonatronum proteinivorum]AXI99454.1 Fic family protein [Cyclonatronum proteinivorum]
MNTLPEEWIWTPLPPDAELETAAILKATITAQQYLAELKGISQTMPNRNILLSTLPLQEAQDSSEVENIVTTQDALFKSKLSGISETDHATKEVSRYVTALNTGFERIRQDGLLTTRHIIAIQQQLEDNDAGIRALAGTRLSNPRTGEIIFVPPQDKSIILRALDNLEQFMNDDEMSSLHPLIKMSIIHYQFESIHPFYDGNGRTGRIINMLYLVKEGLLDLPILYLSRFVIRNKSDYYRLLQRVRTHQDWESWIIFMLQGVAETSRDTIRVITGIRTLMKQYKKGIREQFPFYSQDLINHLFRHPYSKIAHLQHDLSISRPTASKYLEELTAAGYLEKIKEGRENYFLNPRLLRILSGDSP